MARFRPFLIHLFAAVLMLQSGVALAHCLRGMSAGEGMLVEICSSEGIRSIRLDDSAPGHIPGNEASFCPICHGLPGILLPEPPLAAFPAWFDARSAWHSRAVESIGSLADGPPYSTRGPPSAG